MRSQHIEGIAPKPDYCLNGCPLGSRATGFVADRVGARARVGLIMSQPTKNDALSRSPTASYGSFFWQVVLRPNGLSPEDFAYFHILRCNGFSYPLGYERKQAERACRNWDDSGRDELGAPSGAPGLITFNPDLFIITFDFANAVELEAYQSLLCHDIQKALRFASTVNPATGRPFRPALLMGSEPMELVAPWITRAGGGVKRWRGHWWEGSWPFHHGSETTPSYEKQLPKLLKISPAKPTEPQQLGFSFDE